jgi:uncharacterized protein YegP (UPF0339 family)
LLATSIISRDVGGKRETVRAAQGRDREALRRRRRKDSRTLRALTPNALPATILPLSIGGNIGWEAELAYKFEIYKDKAGEYRFRFKSPNGETMCASEGYTAKASALHAIESIKKNSPGAATDDQA